MKANAMLQERKIDILEIAASNYDGDADFFLVDRKPSGGDDWRGMSSLYKRSGEPGPTPVHKVRAVRLDTFLADKCAPDVRFALWIDAEGSAFEVIDGVGGLVEHVQLVHVECETVPCIAPNQRLYADLKALLRRQGFIELATDCARSESQFNALYVRRGQSARMKLAIAASLTHARARRLIVAALRALCPACLHRYNTVRRAPR
jgi:FkbM family methyltransferase